MFLSFLSSLGQVALLGEIPEGRLEGFAVLKAPPDQILRGVSLLCLGSLGNLNLARSVGLSIGTILKEKGIDGYVFGTMDTLRSSDRKPLEKISSSPYITAQVLTLFAQGLSLAGVVPIFDATGQVNPDVVKALVIRKATYPLLVEDKEKYEYLKSLGYVTSLVMDVAGNVLVGKPFEFPWSYGESVDHEKVRRTALENAVVLRDRRNPEISVNDPWKGGVLVFSNEDWLLKIAQEVLEGKRSPTGRSP